MTRHDGFDLGRAMLCFGAAYALYTTLASESTLFFEELLALPSARELGISMVLAPSYRVTAPFHLVIAAFVWPSFAALYAAKGRSLRAYLGYMNTSILSITWLISACIVAYVGFVLCRSEYSMTSYEFFVINQPWVTLILALIFASPWMHHGAHALAALSRRGGRA